MNMNIKLIKESSLHNWNKDIKLSKLINIFHNKEEIRFVGGCIRDVMLGHELRDIDFAINCNPQTTINILTEKYLNKRVNFLQTSDEIIENFPIQPASLVKQLRNV